MPRIIRLTSLDLSQGHCWDPTSPAKGAQTVLVNGFPAVRAQDDYIPHPPSCTQPPTTHAVKAAMGSPTVFIEGLPAHRAGDSLDCGDTAANGSPDVFIDGP